MLENVCKTIWKALEPNQTHQISCAFKGCLKRLQHLIFLAVVNKAGTRMAQLKLYNGPFQGLVRIHYFFIQWFEARVGVFVDRLIDGLINLYIFGIWGKCFS